MSVARLEEQLKRLPTKPGVYLFRNERNDVLYVGKAKSLRPRVRQYFQAGRSDTRMGISQLVDRIADVETIVTQTEVEALTWDDDALRWEESAGRGQGMTAIFNSLPSGERARNRNGTSSHSSGACV